MVQLRSCELGLFVLKLEWYYKLYQKIVAILYKMHMPAGVAYHSAKCEI